MSSKLSRTRLIETDETERNQAQVTAAEIRTWTVYTATCITARTVTEQLWYWYVDDVKPIYCRLISSSICCPPPSIKRRNRRTHGQTTCLLMLPRDTACTRFFLSPDRSSMSDIMGPWSYNYSSMNGTTLTSLLLEPVKQWMVTCKA